MAMSANMSAIANMDIEFGSSDVEQTTAGVLSQHIQNPLIPTPKIDHADPRIAFLVSVFEQADKITFVAFLFANLSIEKTRTHHEVVIRALRVYGLRLHLARPALEKLQRELTLVSSTFFKEMDTTVKESEAVAKRFRQKGGWASEAYHEALCARAETSKVIAQYGPVMGELASVEDFLRVISRVVDGADMAQVTKEDVRGFSSGNLVFPETAEGIWKSERARRKCMFSHFTRRGVDVGKSLWVMSKMAEKEFLDVMDEEEDGKGDKMDEEEDGASDKMEVDVKKEEAQYEEADSVADSIETDDWPEALALDEDELDNKIESPTKTHITRFRQKHGR